MFVFAAENVHVHTYVYMYMYYVFSSGWLHILAYTNAVALLFVCFHAAAVDGQAASNAGRIDEANKRATRLIKD